MRKSTFALALAFLVAIVWLGLQGNQPRAAEDSKPLAKKWEYHLDHANSTNRGEYAELLNKQGSDGWELCIVNQTNNYEMQLIFKRAKQ